jgi:hypothetical protein
MHLSSILVKNLKHSPIYQPLKECYFGRISGSFRTPFQHYRKTVLVMKTVTAGIPVFHEKPLILSLKEAVDSPYKCEKASLFRRLKTLC